MPVNTIGTLGIHLSNWFHALTILNMTIVEYMAAHTLM